MNPRLQTLEVLPDLWLKLLFTNGETRYFDVGNYIRDIPALAGLKNPARFALASVAHGTVAWSDEEDICPDTLYLQSTLEYRKAA